MFKANLALIEFFSRDPRADINLICIVQNFFINPREYYTKYVKKIEKRIFQEKELTLYTDHNFLGFNIFPRNYQPAGHYNCSLSFRDIHPDYGKTFLELKKFLEKNKEYVVIFPE